MPVRYETMGPIGAVQPRFAYGGSRGGGGGGGGGRSPEMRAYELDAQYAAQSELQAQRADQEMQAEELALSRAEELRLQRLQQSLSFVDEQLANGVIDEATANDARFQLRTQIDPMRRRQAAASIQQEQVQTNAMMQQAARLQSLDQQNAEFRSRGLQDRVATVDGVRFLETRPGQWEPISGGAGGINIQQAMTLAQRQLTTEDGPAPTFQEISARAREIMTFGQNQGGQQGQQQQGGGLSVAGLVNNLAGPALRSAAQQAGPAPQAQPPKPPPRVNITDTRVDAMQPHQQAVIAEISARGREIQFMRNIPDEQRREALDLLHQAEVLYRRAGSTPAMTADERRDYEALLARIDRIVQPPQTMPSGAPPTGLDAIRRDMGGNL
jgi:hypothetical protein